MIRINFPPLCVAELKTGREKGRKEERGKNSRSIFTYVQSRARTYTRVPRTHSNTEAQERGGGEARQMVSRGFGDCLITQSQRAGDDARGRVAEVEDA